MKVSKNFLLKIIMVGLLILGSSAYSHAIPVNPDDYNHTVTLTGTVVAYDGLEYAGTIEIKTVWTEDDGYVSTATVTYSTYTYTFNDIDTSRYRDGGTQVYRSSGFNGSDGQGRNAGDARITFSDCCGTSKFREN